MPIHCRWFLSNPIPCFGVSQNNTYVFNGVFDEPATNPTTRNGSIGEPTVARNPV
jgi:hypothetical protein